MFLHTVLRRTTAHCACTMCVYTCAREQAVPRPTATHTHTGDHQPTTTQGLIVLPNGMAKIFNTHTSMAKMCLNRKKTIKHLSVQKKNLGVGGRMSWRGSGRRCAPPPPHARFAASPAAETSKTAAAAAPSAHIYVNLANGHPFQAVGDLSPGMRYNPSLVKTPPAHAASALKNLRRCRPPP
jgi:hypothetical protein